MEERLHYTKVSPGAYHALLGLEKRVATVTELVTMGFSPDDAGD